MELEKKFINRYGIERFYIVLYTTNNPCIMIRILLNLFCNPHVKIRLTPRRILPSLLQIGEGKVWQRYKNEMKPPELR